jgi:protein disulfide-isomerase
MKTLLTYAVGALAALALTTSAALAKSPWSEDFKKASAQAKTEKKLLLIDFTGSDWCSWCMKLDKEVFSQKEFEEYAKTNLVLLEADFPNSKPQTRKIKEQNEKLKAEYGIKGFPTIIVLDSEGNKVGQLGYQAGGPAPFIAALDKMKK